MKLLTLSGSLRSDSVNTRLLAFTEDLARRAGHEVGRFEHVGRIPPFNEDDEGRPALVIEVLREEIAAADAVLIATPEYNGSVPGQLKNLLDWASRPDGEHAFIDKPAAVISASPSGFGAAWARESVEHVLSQIGAVVEPTGWGLSRAHQWAVGDDSFIDEDAADRLRYIVGRLAGTAGTAEAPVAA